MKTAIDLNKDIGQQMKMSISLICKPVRGFDTLMGAMAWAIKTGRKVIYEVEGAPAYKLPDHHNKFGEAYWIDQDVPIEKMRCVRW